MGANQWPSKGLNYMDSTNPILPQDTPRILGVDVDYDQFFASDLAADFAKNGTSPHVQTAGAPSTNGAGYHADGAPGAARDADPHAESDTAGAETAPNMFDAWAPVSVAEYANKPLTERRYLVSGLLPIHGVTVFHGMPGSLKTQLVLDAASCVATGCEWLPQVGEGGGVTFATTRAPVLWLNFDMADEDIHERAAAVYRTRPLPEGAVFDVVSLPTPWLSLSGVGVALQLAEWVRLRGYGLVVIDNFSNVKGAAKLIDESIADVMLNIRRMSKLAECAVWVIHHETKNTVGKSAFERMYGGVHIAASVEAAFSVTRNGDSVTLNASKQRGHMSTTAFSALHTYMQHADSTLDTFKFFASATPGAIQEDTAGVAGAPLQHDLLRILLANPLSYKSVDDLVTALGGDYTQNSARNALNKMADKGLVRRKTVGKVTLFSAAPSNAQETPNE